LDHSSRFLDVDINYYWIKINEAAQFKPQNFEQFDGVWIAPGPFTNIFYLNGIIRVISTLTIPVLLTGESMRNFIEVLINLNQLNIHGEKLISDNLIEGNQFERIQVVPHSKAFVLLYENHNTVELTSSRYSLYPQLIDSLTQEFVDIEAYNQFDEPEIVSLKKHDFFLATAFCPQISSTREIPHPIIYTFIKAVIGQTAPPEGLLL
jgi:CTP synthase (UTP-ammonia lyase)